MKKTMALTMLGVALSVSALAAPFVPSPTLSRWAECVNKGSICTVTAPCTFEDVDLVKTPGSLLDPAYENSVSRVRETANRMFYKSAVSVGSGECIFIFSKK